MTFRLRTTKPDDYLSPFNIEGLPDLCILTGLNGAGKTRLLDKIKSGEIVASINGQDIPTRRILSIDSSSFVNYQHNNTLHSSSHMHNTDMTSSIAHRVYYDQDYTNEMAYAEIKSQLGILDSEYGEQIIDSIAKRDFAFLNELNNKIKIKLYNSSIAYHLKTYYDVLVNNAMTIIAQSQGRKVEAIVEPYDLENLLNYVLNRLDLNYIVYGKEQYVEFMIDQRLRSLGASIFQDQNLSNLYNTSTFSIQLFNKDNNSIIDVNSLSSGEKALLSIASLLANEVIEGEANLRPVLILLDEPDAHLHPKYVSVLIDLIQSEFVEKLNFKILLATHSPITMSVAEANHSLLMHRGVLEMVGARRALSNLMAGVSYIDVLNRKNIYVFTESHNDKRVYSAIYSIISKTKSYPYEPVFIPSSQGGKGGNCDMVKHIVENLPDERIFHGIVDWDLVNTPIKRIHVLSYEKRYTIQNVLFDPFCLVMFIISRGHDKSMIPALSEDMTTKGLLKDKRLLSIACEQVARHIIEDEASTSFKECDYWGGEKIEILTKYMETPGHELESLIKIRVPNFKRYTHGLDMEIVKFMREHPEVISMDFIDVYDEILTADAADDEFSPN